MTTSLVHYHNFTQSIPHGPIHPWPPTQETRAKQHNYIRLHKSQKIRA